MRHLHGDDLRSYAWPALLGAAVLVALNAAANPSFIEPANWASVLAAATPFVLTAMAQAAPVLSGDGGIDLSVGPLAGLTNAIIVAWLLPSGLDGPFTVVAITIAIGIASGLVNGLLVAVARVQPIIATLGTFVAYQGLTLHVLPTAGGTAPDWLRALAGSIAGIPGLLLVFLAIAVLWLLLGRTAFRRNLLATGGDERAAYTAGVNVTGVRIAAYVISGILAAVAGLAFTAVLGSADPSVGAPYTLISVAGVALGGVALSGGRGGLLGAAAGGAILFLIENLLTLAQMSIFYLQIAYGVILLAALAVNAANDRLRRRRMAARLG